MLLTPKLRDRSIYTECVIHLVGAHPAQPWPTRRARLAPELNQLIARKSKELAQQCATMDRDLLLLTINIGTSTSNRNTHATHTQSASILSSSERETWLIIQLSKDEVANALNALHAPQNSRIYPLERGNLYRKLKQGYGYREYKEVLARCRAMMPGGE